MLAPSVAGSPEKVIPGRPEREGPNTWRALAKCLGKYILKLDLYPYYTTINGFSEGKRPMWLCSDMM